MFPTIRCSFSGFQDFGQKFAIVLDVVSSDNKRYRYAYHRSSWLVAGKADPPPPKRQYLHPDSPFSVKQLERKRLSVSFEKVKLTNNESDKTGQVSNQSTCQQGPGQFGTFITVQVLACQ